MNFNVFTYGSLMFDQVWSQVVRGTYDKTDAKLYGYTRKGVINETYPAVVPGEGKNFVAGKLYLDVSKNDIQLLDTFEGEYYQRKVSECDLPDNRITRAYVYVFKEEYRNLLTDEDWDPFWFSKVGLRAFLDEYRGLSETAYAVDKKTHYKK